MLIIGSALVSEDILEAHFACQLNACKGECCVQGDVGAPLEQSELALIEANLDAISNVLTVKSVEMLREEGFWEEDEDSEPVTLCHPSGDCVFAIREGGITLCGIEKIWREGKQPFQKPISCHLYPIRVANYGEFTVFNYHRWDICNPACSEGKKAGIPLFRFLKDALIRKMGQAWYQELDEIAVARGIAPEQA